MEGDKQMNPMKLMKIKPMLEKFGMNHPKVPMFFQRASQSIEEGTVIDISVTTVSGENFRTNMRVTADDLELLKQLKELSRN